ncbi:MAG: family 10 glycosylhydrolase [Balneolales bacterium]
MHATSLLNFSTIPLTSLKQNLIVPTHQRMTINFGVYNKLFLILVTLFIFTASCSTFRVLFPPPEPDELLEDMPEVPREFRAAWIATVANIDWPSEPGLSTKKQKADLRLMLDRMVAMNMNAVILQVRPGADAIYLSAYEPWSEVLTGEMGKAPTPFYDPLAFAVEEAHKRGVELHAWFNPFRAFHSTSKSKISADHISKLNPKIVREYGNYLWLDPGSQAAQDHSIRVITDVIQRYDIDGVHLDDYFYPYKQQDSTGAVIDFPDDLTWVRNSKGLAREDWRRDNVNSFIERLYAEIKRVDPQVRFGISPFGIWRPGFPAGIKGFDAFTEIYADSRKWLQNGWVDYFSPQLYWAIGKPGQSYPVLLNWWHLQNDHKRHLWPGNFTSRIGSGGGIDWKAGEIIAQVEATRESLHSEGNIHYSIKALMEDRDGLAGTLAGETYKVPALVPATTWLGGATPGIPEINIRQYANTTELTMNPADGETAWLWAIHTYGGENWKLEIIPGWKHIYKLEESPDFVAVSAVSRLGIEGEAASVRTSLR